MLELPVTLASAALAALINLWLAARCGKMRGQTKVFHGDDGGGPLTRRMRAQLNYVENTPFVLILMGAIEIEGKGGMWLAIVAAVYFLGRIAHAFGMDIESFNKARMIGTLVSMLTLLGLSIYALLVWFHVL